MAKLKSSKNPAHILQINTQFNPGNKRAPEYEGARCKSLIMLFVLICFMSETVGILKK